MTTEQQAVHAAGWLVTQRLEVEHFGGESWDVQDGGEVTVLGSNEVLIAYAKKRGMEHPNPWVPIDQYDKENPKLVLIGSPKWKSAYPAIWNRNFGVFASSSEMKTGITIYDDVTHFQDMPEPPTEATNAP